MTDQHMELIERIANLANETGKALGAAPNDRARFKIVKRLVKDADIVFGIWQDPAAKGGVNYLLVKGNQMAREVVADKHAISARVVAIPCIDADQATALMQEFGEADRRH